MPLPPTLGTIVRSSHVASVHIIETVHPPGLVLATHEHEHPSINITLSGSYDEVFPRRTVVSRAGSVVVKPGGVRHANRYADVATRCMMLELPPAVAHSITNARAVAQVWHAESGPAVTAMREIWNELELPDSASPLMIESCVLRVLAEAVRGRSYRRPMRLPLWLAQVQAFIHSNASRPVSLAELARVANVHPGHLTKAFRRHFGTSMGQYQRHLQLERARTLLAETEQPISWIAAELGFADQSHFTRTFRAQVGATPSDFRRARGADRSSRRAMFKRGAAEGADSAG